MRFATAAGGLVAEGLAWREVRRGDPEYPLLLGHVPDPPGMLWVAGCSLATLPPCVAVVGTRSPTAYGQQIAHTLAAELARAGVCVVSGLARGIDAWAHTGALSAGVTVAVLACGVDRCYPASNRELYERIAAEGALVSELPPGTPTHKRRFPARNRIIAGMSLAAVVVQAGERSGALITARHALAAGREVLAVPGDVRLEVSAGPHDLLRDGAALCASAGDVLERIGVELRREARERGLEPLPDDLPGDQARVLALLGTEPMPAEPLGLAAGLEGAALARTLVRLELAGWVGRGPGGTVRRLR